MALSLTKFPAAAITHLGCRECSSIVLSKISLYAAPSTSREAELNSSKKSYHPECPLGIGSVLRGKYLGGRKAIRSSFVSGNPFISTGSH